MGMFDTVLVNCPTCTCQIEVQSKAGSCILEFYSVNNAPDIILRDIQKDYMYCECCEKSFKVGDYIFVKESPEVLQKHLMAKFSLDIPIGICESIIEFLSKEKTE